MSERLTPEDREFLANRPDLCEVSCSACHGKGYKIQHRIPIVERKIVYAELGFEGTSLTQPNAKREG